MRRALALNERTRLQGRWWQRVERHSDAWLRGFFRTVQPSCPAEFRGVWWTCDAEPVGLLLLCMHHLEFDAAGALFANHVNTARSTTVMGLVGHVTSAAGRTSIVVRDADWIQTDVYCSVLGLSIEVFTLWIHRDRRTPDEMLRLQYDRRGRLTYQYRLRRIAYEADGRIVRTSHYTDFVERWAGTPFVARVP